MNPNATETPIILLHGAGCDHRFMIACMEPLVARQLGWQGIYLDLPSMGQPPSTEAIKSSDDMLAFVVNYIDAIIPEHPFLPVPGSFESRCGQWRPSALSAVTSFHRHAGHYLRVGRPCHLEQVCYNPAVWLEEAPVSKRPGVCTTRAGQTRQALPSSVGTGVAWASLPTGVSRGAA